MPERTDYAPGEPAWVDLTTDDAGAAVTFYRTIFGWDDEPVDAPDAGGYTMLSLGGRHVGALVPRMAGDPAPPRWTVYVNVPDLDAALESVGGAGGQVLMPALDVLTAGRMALISDPGGAVLALWQADQHPGAAVMDEPGALTWVELSTDDTAAAQAFYGEVFGWTAETSDGGGLPYTEFALGDKRVAGMMPKAPGMPADVPPYWMPYFQVTDPDKVAGEVTALGGTIIAPPDEIPSGGRYAVLTDPQGAFFGLYRPA